MKKITLWVMVVSLILPLTVFAAPPDKPSGSGNMAGSSSSSVSYKGANTITSSETLKDKSYSSSTGGENALLVSGGESTIENITLEKTGDESSESSDFYGTNAGLLAYNNAILNINGGNITTNGSHANAVFSYGTGKINLSNVTITTSANNSGGVMVTGGGILNANNCTVKTSGNSSASIRSDRGGGTLVVGGGTYETNGVGSPAIYSTADITVKNATLTSTKSEGVVVEGANSITLETTNLIDNNTTLNGNSETYKNIFLYQSMSGDADLGTASFTAKNSNIETSNGDTIFVTNTTASINLENNVITNSSGDFLRIQTGKWGTSGSNGGKVTMNLVNQKVTGNIIVDSISTLDLTLTNGSVISGAINSDNTAKSIKVTLSSDSTLVLTDDTYLTSLDNEDSENSNIYANGHKLYVDNGEVTINQDTYEENETSTNINTPIVDSTDNTSSSSQNDFLIPIVILGIGIVSLIVTLIIKKRKK